MPITRTISHVVDAAPEALYRAIATPACWPKWDAGILRVDAPPGEASAGTRFTLKPKGGPTVRLVVEAAEPPHRFVDVALLPLGRMRTIHEFTPQADGRTRIGFTLETRGALAFLWDRLVARPQLAGAAAQAEALAAFARRAP